MRALFIAAALSLALTANGIAEIYSVAEFPNPSEFSLEKITRDPFSSIDQKDEPKPAESQPMVLLSGKPDGIGPDLFQVSTISIAKFAIAIINHKAFVAGDSFSIKAAERVIKVAVAKVNDGDVVLELEGRKLTVPLRRK